ncbi:membrane protein insertase YidC [Corynebacterium anserum]|uniref:Membrane protein insertase YidC n=1 Tax=Corynebacterium anserum TaxID=2684406 RepID=A0A7G7YLK2_9CORY|nr:membrane protein insertase YidC [Corynebacterium anserum]
MIVLEYPVAFILTTWHWLLTTFFGMEATFAWLCSIPLLVATIRACLLPLIYRQYRSSRLLAHIRLDMRGLRAQYSDKKDQESQRQLRAKRREMQASVGYRVSDGCFPPLIQIPVIMGLYRLLLHIARPQEGLDAVHHGRGLLTGHDVSQFLHTTFSGIPLPAYVAMPPQRLDYLNVTSDEVFRVALPLIFVASVCTTANYIYSLRRSLRTIDYSVKASRILMRIMWCLAPIILLFPWFFGIFGPAPLAILIYWVCNNLWTAIQAVTVNALE